MIDIDTIIKNIEGKIDFLEKLKFEDDKKDFLYTPITSVTISSTTDFKQLECQKFMRCPRTNNLIPYSNFEDSIVPLKDENSEVHPKIKYRRNSIANSSINELKRRKFDLKNDSGRNKLENGYTATSSPSTVIRESSKFSRSYTEFLNNLNKDMEKFKEQQMRNEPCDNFLGKEAKIFVEDPIGKKFKTTESHPIHGKKVPENVQKSAFNKLVKRRMTIDSGQNSRSLLKKNFESPQKIQQQMLSLSPKKPSGQRDNIQKPQNSTSSTEKLKKLQRIVKMIPRRNSIGYGVLIESASDIKRIKLSQEAKCNSIVEKTNQQKQLPDSKSVVCNDNPEEQQKGDLSSSIDFEDEIENISACHIDKLAHKSTDDDVVVIDDDSGDLSENKTNSKRKKYNKRIRKIKSSLNEENNIKKAKIQNKNQTSSFIVETNTSGDQNKLIKLKFTKAIEINSTEDSGSASEDNMKFIKPKTLEIIDVDSTSINPNTSEDNKDAIKPNIQKVNDPKYTKTNLNASGDNVRTAKTKIQKTIVTESTKINPNASKDNTETSTSKNQKKIDKSTAKISLHASGDKLRPIKPEIQQAIDIDSSRNESSSSEDNTKFIKRKIQKANDTNSTKINPNTSEDNIEASTSKIQKKVDIGTSKVNPNAFLDNLSSIKTKIQKVVGIESVEISSNGSEDKTNATKLKIQRNNQTSSSEDNINSIKPEFRKINSIESIKKLKSDIVDKPQTKNEVDHKNNNNSKTIASLDQKITPSNPSNTNQEVEISNSNKIDPKILQDKKDIDIVTIKTLDIFRDIENCKKLIKQRSSDSQSSRNSEPNVSQEQNLVGTIRIAGNLFPEKEKGGDNVKQIKEQMNTKVEQIEGTFENEKEVMIEEESDTRSNDNIDQSNRSVNSEYEANEAQDPNNQSLSKRRRQINPKYNESEYMLKNTSKEFTNAIRAKMAINKVQKSTNQDESKPQKSTSSKLFKCDICNRSFTNKKGLGRHKPFHLKELNLYCRKCEFKFDDRNSLNRHMQEHEELQNIPCPKCEKVFISENHLQDHLKHYIHASLPFKCDKCEIRFRSAMNLRYHLMSYHGIHFQCGFCGSKFPSEKSLQTHEKMHKNEIKDLDKKVLKDNSDFMDEDESNSKESMVIDEN